MDSEKQYLNNDNEAIAADLEPQNVKLIELHIDPSN